MKSTLSLRFIAYAATRLSEADKRQILLEAMRPDARFSEVTRVF
jgi:hypothetical protein